MDKNHGKTGQSPLPVHATRFEGNKQHASHGSFITQNVTRPNNRYQGQTRPKHRAGRESRKTITNSVSTAKHLSKWYILPIGAQHFAGIYPNGAAVERKVCRHCSTFSVLTHTSPPFPSSTCFILSSKST
ncbi:unnamed protein product [Ectocarpus sp. 4 AP-2014]